MPTTQTVLLWVIALCLSQGALFEAEATKNARTRAVNPLSHAVFQGFCSTGIQKPAEENDQGLNSAVYGVLHAQQCRQALLRRGASEGERGLHSIPVYLEEGCVRQDRTHQVSEGRTSLVLDRTDTLDNITVFLCVRLDLTFAFLKLFVLDALFTYFFFIII